MTAVPMSQWPSEHRYTIPVAPGEDLVTITVDGNEVQAPRGELLIKVAQDHGTFIPRFCWHERMKPVGMCRMCLVEVEGARGLQIACATPVSEGMVVRTATESVAGAQDGVLELLLINHPLDCPVCDRGGECPLQDQTLAFGPGESRFVEEKRHFEKPVPISDLVMLDRERCIQCGRCTRFAAEVAGDPLIDFGGRGGETQVITYPDEPFSSYLSGNTVQICPVGALTSTPYRFRARPWDLQSVESTCQTCAVGCRSAVDQTSNRLVRMLGVDSEPVNQGWLCDKGRYGHEWVHSESRLRTPMVRAAGGMAQASWVEALDAAAAALRRVQDESGPGAIAVLGGSRGTNEDAYAWSRLAKSVLGTDHVDAQLGDGLPAEVVLGMGRATIPELDAARAIVLLGVDPKEELPVLGLRIRRAVVDLGVPLVDLGTRDHGLTRHAAAVLRHAPGVAGEVAAQLAGALSGRTVSPGLRTLADALSGRTGPVVVVAGRPSAAEAPDATVHALATLAASPDVRLLSALPTANVHGALELGLAPGFLPGRVTLDGGRDHVRRVWGAVPDSVGGDAGAILRACASGDVRALVLLECDPLTEFPDRALARAALERVERVIVVGAYPEDGVDHADVVLPPTVWGEHAGTTTNLEGRVSRLGRVVAPGGVAMESWRIATELASRLGVEFGFATVDEVTDEIARVAPAFAGVDSGLLRRARDGVVLPLAEHVSDVVLSGADTAATGPSWEPIPPRPLDTSTGGLTVVGPPVELHRWSGSAPEPGAAVLDSYSLRLHAARTLYGADRVTTRSPALATRGALATPLLVSPRDRDRLGAIDGDLVRVTSPRVTLEMTILGDARLPLGVASVPFNREGPGAADLIDASVPVTDLRVETLP